MEPDRSTVREQARRLLAEASENLRRAGVDSPDLDAQLLLAACANVDRGRLLTGSLTLDNRCIDCFRQLVARRAAREPLAYIVGHKEFYGLNFEVSRDVLIPRPETELLVEAALRAVRTGPRLHVLDLGTGCGAIAVAIAANAPDVHVLATDVSPAALAVARRNAVRHGCARRVEFALADCFEGISSHSEFDLIISNPPYVSDGEMARLQPEVARCEPQIALRGGKDGLDFYRRIAAQAASHLASGSGLLLETGAGQASAVARILAQHGFEQIQTLRDLAGHERVVRARSAV